MTGRLASRDGYHSEMLKFLAIGDWAAEQVCATSVAAGRRIIPQVEEAIDATWRAALGRSGIKLFDGPMCRLESWQASEEQLILAWSQTSYRPFFGTNLSHPNLAERYGTEVMANPLGVSPALVTKDGFLLLGRRNAEVAYYPNRVHPFAGALEPRDGNDVFAAVRRELHEELGLDASAIEDTHCTGLVEDDALRQPELIFRVLTSRTRRQIEAQVLPDEHRDSVAILADQDAIGKAVSAPALTPVAVASLMLWGRVKFGGEWFADVQRLCDSFASP